MENFTELKHCYRVEVYQYSTDRRFVSHESFKTYEEAWNYGKTSTKQFGVCGYCVIEFDEPELQLGNINFDEVNNNGNLS